MSKYTFGQYLRAVRKKQGVSQVELAQRAQVSARSIAYWEKDEYTPGSHEMQAALNALGVPAQEKVNVLMSLSALRGEKIVRHDTVLQASARNMSLPGAGDLLAALRMRQGLTRQEAAERLNTTETTLSRWENNRFRIPEQVLPLIQEALNGSFPEMQALHGRMAQPLEAEEPFSWERCAQWVEAFRAVRYEPGTHSVDLDALVLQRKLWLLAVSHPEVRTLLARVNLDYADWLSLHNRKDEVCQQAQSALNIYLAEPEQESAMAEALNLLSWCKAFGPQWKPELALRFLKQWLTRIDNPQIKINLLADTSLYAAHAGNPDLALRYFQDAQRVFETSNTADDTQYNYLQLTYARILYSNGNPREAYAVLTRILPVMENIPENTPPRRYLMFAEILIAAGEREAAKTWLCLTHARLRHLEAPRLRTEAARLTRLLQI